jgi:hypothetical protein
MWLFATAALFAFVFLLIKFPRRVHYVLLGLVGIGAVCLYIWQQDANEKKPAAVLLLVTYDLKACQPHFPLHVVISNRTGSFLKSVDFNWAAFVPRSQLQRC